MNNFFFTFSLSIVLNHFLQFIADELYIQILIDNTPLNIPLTFAMIIITVNTILFIKKKIKHCNLFIIKL